MAEIDLGPGLGSISSHDVEEKIRVARPFSTTLEIEGGVEGDIIRAILLISMRTGRSIFNSRLKISVNGFSVSRVARPASELQFGNMFHSIFLYDLAPIRDKLQERVEIDIESRDMEALVDGISLVTIHTPHPGENLVESQNRIHVGPYLLHRGEKIYLRARSYSGGDLLIRGIAITNRRADIKLGLSINKSVQRLPLTSSMELSLKLCGTIADGSEEIELEGVCVDGECLVKIPWIFVGASNKRSPEYVIRDIKLSREKQELIVDFENRGDFEARELNIVALWKGVVIGRAVEKPSRRGVARIPLNAKALAVDKTSPSSPIIVRLIWRWMGFLEEREKIFKPDLQV